MRLSTDQIQAVRHAANTAFGEDTAVWVTHDTSAIVSVTHQTRIRLQ